MIKKVLQAIKQHNLIEQGDTVITGVSGGPDSVCLLHVLKTLSIKLQFNIFAVHINHLLRENESDTDEHFVITLCEKWGIPCHVERIDVGKLAATKRISLEEAGREARYDVFEKVRQAKGAQKIAVAHHMNDQAETVLMHIIRGTGLDGIKGMEIRRGSIIRPLLNITRYEVEQYLDKEGIEARIDFSNLETVYSRNRVRLELIPTIDRLFGGNIVENLSRMAQLTGDDASALKEISIKAFENCLEKQTPKGVWLKVPVLRQYHPAVIKRVLREAILAVTGSLKDVESKHLEAMKGLVDRDNSGNTLDLPGKLKVSREYLLLKIEINEYKEILEYSLPLKIPGITYENTSAFTIITEICNRELLADMPHQIKKTGFTQFFDYNLVREVMYIRTRKPGDIFKPLNSNGTKKLKEYFIDNKIPRDIRNSFPLLASSEEIMWIVGNNISDKFKVSENTKKVLRIQIVQKHIANQAINDIIE